MIILVVLVGMLAALAWLLPESETNDTLEQFFSQPEQK